MRKPLLIGLAVAAPVLAMTYFAGTSTSYTVKDPKGVNSISFTLDGRLEQIRGIANGITGDVTFDPENPSATRGKIVVPVKSITTSHANMTEHLHGSMWLDMAKYPNVEFVVKKVANVKKTGSKDPTWTMSVTGDFSMHGVTKSITIPVKVTHLPGELSNRNRGPGDMMVFRAKFQLKRSDFGIGPGQSLDIVSDEIDVSFSIASFAPAPRG